MAAYVNLVPADIHLLTALDDSHVDMYEWLKHVTAVEGARYTYAAGKWTVAQTVQHLIDSERVFNYRALRFARADATPLSGFDQDAFVAAVGQVGRPLAELREEFDTIRASTRALFKSFDDEAMDRAGLMGGHNTTVRGLGFGIAGHTWHHLHIFREHYGQAQKFV